MINQAIKSHIRDTSLCERIRGKVPCIEAYAQSTAGVKECDPWDALHFASFRNDFKALPCPQDRSIKRPKLEKKTLKSTCKQILAKEFPRL